MDHDQQMPIPHSESYTQKRHVLILTKFALVLLLSSSGMGRNTARAIQFAKMVNKMMISKVLDKETQEHNNNMRRTDAVTPKPNMNPPGIIHGDNI